MATKQLTLPGSLVKKDNRLVRTKINITSVDASRILANLVACIHVDDQDLSQIYSVAVKDFLNVPGGGNYTRIKNLCRELAQATAELEEPDPDGPHPIFIARPFFSNIRYRRGVVEALFNPTMGPLLLDLKKYFTKYNLLDYLKLPSVYSQRIFEILKSWSGMPEVILQVKELHHMLATPPSFRADFRQFRRRVLEKAYKDIHAHTELTYEWEPIKKGRSVEAVRFIFAQKRALPIAEEKEKKAIQKQSDKNNELLSRATRCRKERGPDCTGGYEAADVCEMCLRLKVIS